MTAGEIRELRKSLGLNRPGFAEQLGVAPRTVEFWEQGRGRPKRDIEERIESLKTTE